MRYSYLFLTSALTIWQAVLCGCDRAPADPSTVAPTAETPAATTRTFVFYANGENSIRQGVAAKNDWQLFLARAYTTPIGQFLLGMACLLGLLGSIAVAPAARAHGVRAIATFVEAIEVRATYDSGEPMVGAQAIAYAPDRPEAPYQKGTTDVEGRFVFVPDRTIPGEWTIVVRQAGHGGIARIETNTERSQTAANLPDPSPATPSPTAPSLATPSLAAPSSSLPLTLFTFSFSTLHALANRFNERRNDLGLHRHGLVFLAPPRSLKRYFSVFRLFFFAFHARS